MSEAAYKPTAEEKKAAGQKAGGGDRKSEKAKNASGEVPRKRSDESARTTAVAAKAVGMGGLTVDTSQWE